MIMYYNIADLVVRMNSFGRTSEQAEKYITEPVKMVDIAIESYHDYYQLLYPQMDDDTCEYMGTGRSFYTKLIEYDGLMLHSSAVVVGGKAYLFTAHSGTGKSTHTNLWLESFSDSFIINDDKPALRRIDDIWYAYGTPWSGKFDISVNTRAPLAGIAVLERDVNNSIERCSAKEAILKIYAQLYRRTETAQFREKQLELLDKLLTEVPVWKLKCNMDPEAAIVSYEAMSGEKWRK